MSFRDGAYVYSDFEPSEDYREVGSTVIANKIRMDNDEWIDEMVGQHANQFLRSIQQTGDKVRVRSPVHSRSNNNYMHNAEDEDRNDTMRRDRNATSPIAARKKYSFDSGNYINIGTDDERDDNENMNRTIISEIIEKHVNNGVADPISSTVQHHCISSTERSGSSNYISSTESGESDAFERISYADSIQSTDSKILVQQERSGTPHQQGREIRLSMSPTQSILDDLQDMKAKIRLPRSDDRLSKGHRRSDSMGGVYPERALWKLLLERQWDWAQERVRLHPREAGERIWLPIASLDSADDNEKYLQNIEESDNVYSALPLHLACSVRPLPPTALLKDLIDAYPEACHHCEESSGFLPIHMAADMQLKVGFRNTSKGKRGQQKTGRRGRERDWVGMGSDSIHQCKVDSANHGDIIELLLASYPASIARKETTNGMTPLHIAASTTRAENGIVSPVASNVLSILMTKGLKYPATSSKDKKGMTPKDLAWRNIEFFCPHCGLQTTETTKPNGDGTNQDKALSKLNDGTRCECTQSLSVHEKCLHPLLAKEIRRHLLASAKASSSIVRYKSESDTFFMPKAQPNQRFPNPTLSELLAEGAHDILSRRVLDSIRASNYQRVVTKRGASKKDLIEPEKTASLHMKIRLSDLLHPSIQGKKRGFKIKGCCVPSPYFEVFAAHRRGMSKTYYRSYPLHEADSGIWEDAFLDLGLTHGQLRNGTHGAGYIEIGIRVMHCPESGSGIKLIGTCQLSLEALQREHQEWRKLRKDLRRFREAIGDDVRRVDVTLPEPEKHPILNGFKVTGNLQVLKLAIK